MHFSREKFWIHINSHIVYALALYSFLALDLVTRCCFLLLQVTRLSQTRVELDPLSIEDLAQFASKKYSQDQG